MHESLCAADGGSGSGNSDATMCCVVMGETHITLDSYMRIARRWFSINESHLWAVLLITFCINFFCCLQSNGKCYARIQPPLRWYLNLNDYLRNALHEKSVELENASGSGNVSADWGVCNVINDVLAVRIGLKVGRRHVVMMMGFLFLYKSEWHTPFKHPFLSHIIESSITTWTQTLFYELSSIIHV